MVLASIARVTTIASDHRTVGATIENNPTTAAHQRSLRPLPGLIRITIVARTAVS